MTPRVGVVKVRFYVRNIRTRFPFKYGIASMEAMPLLHARVWVRDAQGRSAEGVSADILAPKWFDKSPEKDYRRNVEDLIEAARRAAQVFMEESEGLDTCFGLWHRAYRRLMAEAEHTEVPKLVAGCGSAFMERAMLDAVARIEHRSFADALRSGALGFDAGTVHKDLRHVSLENVLSRVPAASVLVRHTVGFADPLRDSDIMPGDRLDDGLPQSLEASIRAYGLRRFKVKVHGNHEEDRERLVRVSDVLSEATDGEYQVTLDGNEQIADVDQLGAWWEVLKSEPRLDEFLQRVLFLEQPLERRAALTATQTSQFESMPSLPPVVIDESDDDLDAFRKAADLGYRGVTLKNCKGVFKGMLNHMLVQSFNAGGGAFVLSGEDLTNLPSVALQQDLCAVSVHGLEHVERNGHHYVRGLDHLSSREREACLATHGSLYERVEGGARLRIQEGRIDLRTLHCEGFGVGIPVDFADMTPLEDWSFEALEAGQR